MIMRSTNYRKNVFTLLMFLFIVSAGSTKAQSLQTMYHMNLPQNHLMNPALFSTNSVYIGLPGLSGAQVNFGNNLFDFSDIIIAGSGLAGDSLITFLHPDYETEKFIELINDRNYINADVEVPILGLGFRAGDLTFSFDIIEKGSMYTSLPGDLLRLGLQGNEQFAGDAISLKEFGLKANYYREYGLGFSMPVGSKLRLGAKGKLLFGKVNANLDIQELQIAVDAQTYAHTFTSDLSMNFSGPVELITNAEGDIEDIQTLDVEDPLDILLNGKNSGFAIDLGATWELLPELTLSASIIDLGFINWKDQVTNLTSQGSYSFTGLDISDVLSDEQDFEELAEVYLDSLVNALDFEDSYNAYKTGLPTKLYIGANYKLAEQLSLGLLSRTIYMDKSLRQALTLSANAYLGNFFSLSASYTMANRSYDHLGFGLAFRGGPLQFYLLSDHIPVSLNKIVADGGDTEVPVPASLKTLNLRFGFNLMFGNNVKKRNDVPMLAN